jgi:hypothetical protein
MESLVTLPGLWALLDPPSPSLALAGVGRHNASDSRGAGTNRMILTRFRKDVITLHWRVGSRLDEGQTRRGLLGDG